MLSDSTPRLLPQQEVLKSVYGCFACRCECAQCCAALCATSIDRPSASGGLSDEGKPWQGQPSLLSIVLVQQSLRELLFVHS